MLQNSAPLWRVLVLALAAVLAISLPCSTEAASMTAWTNPSCSGTPFLVSTFTVGKCTANNDGGSYMVRPLVGAELHTAMR